MHFDLPSRRLALATSVVSPGISADDMELVSSLQALAISAEPAVWNDGAVDWTRFDAVLVRSVWDYYKHYEAFLGWLTQLERSGVPTINPGRVLRWNSDKRYLLQLPSFAVDIVPTRLSSADQLPRVLASMQGTEVVVKPTVSAGAWHTVHGVAGSDDLDQTIRALPAHLQYLVQPFVSEVASDGEWSLLFFGGDYSHAVRKRPAQNDFRVQTELGGSVEVSAPGEDIVLAARTALSAVRALGLPEVSYARVDGVRSRGRFLIMEIELIEPFLFLSRSPAASRRFAGVIARALGMRIGVGSDRQVSA